LGRRQGTGISIRYWNGHGSFWSSSGLLYDALESTDILFVTETHASPIRPLPNIADYHWFSVCRQETRSSGKVRGSGGVACLASDSLRNIVSLVAEDEFAKFMWIRISIRVSPPRDIYIAVCYFPPASSPFSIHNGSNGDPFIDLYTGITQYSVVGEVILLGDFNAHTKDLQVPLHYQSEDVLCTQGIDQDSVGLPRMSDDALGPTTVFSVSLSSRIFILQAYLATPLRMIPLFL
jgi:hypothetical protein